MTGRFTFVVAAMMYAATATADDGRVRAKQLVDEGNEHFAAERYDEAIAKFEAALAAFDSPKIHVNLAEAYRAKGEDAEAVRQYERFLARGTSDPAIRRRIQERAAELEAKIGRVELVGEASARIESDEWNGKWHAGLRIPVAPGQHVFTVFRDGQSKLERTLDVTAGEIARLVVEDPIDATPPIDLSAKPAPPTTAVVTAPTEDDGVTSKWWFWASVGGAVVVIVGASVVAATTGGDDRLPMGELERTSTADWTGL